VKEDAKSKSATAASSDQTKATEKMDPREAALREWEAASRYRDDFEKSRPHLLNAVKLDPQLCVAWNALGRQALVSSDLSAARDYLKKASDCEPTNGSYAEGYLEALRPLDFAAYRAGVEGFAQRFPNYDMGPRVLSSLAAVTENIDEKIAILERIPKLYPPDRFLASIRGLMDLFDVYVGTNPEKALAIAQKEAQSTLYEGAVAKLWQEPLQYASAVVSAKNLLRQNKTAEARDALAKVRRADESVLELQAEIYQALDDHAGAYKLLLERVAQHRTNRTDAALKAAGAKLGKDAGKVEAEIWEYRLANAKPLKPFELTRFDSGEKVTLAGLKGKVVLLNFFFPT
jgi:hypothetical protein